MTANDRESGDASEPLSITFVGDDPEILNTLTTMITLTWTLAGTDADDFNIADGVLTFKSGPDFEAPTDSGRNNVYEVTVQATDAAGNTASQRVKITVENVGEVGVITLSHTQPEDRGQADGQPERSRQGQKHPLAVVQRQLFRCGHCRTRQ